MSIRDMEPNEVLAWGKMLGLLMRNSQDVDVTVWQEDGYYADYVDVRFRDGSTTIRIRVEHADPVDEMAGDLVKMLDELRQHNPPV